MKNSRKLQQRKAAATKARRSKVKPAMSPKDAYSQGEWHYHRRSYKKAKQYFCFAAGRGISKAWGKLAVLYFRGLGGAVDHDLARLAIKGARVAAKLEEMESRTK